MTNKRDKLKISILVALMAFGLCVQASAGYDRDESLFREAKLLIFDKKWEQAQEKLEELLEDYPKSPLYAQALFYKGKCLKELPGGEADAIKTFRSYIARRDSNRNLVKESETAIIELSFSLYERGRKSYIKEIEDRLRGKDKEIRYYAAFTLSKAEEKKYARKAVPVLEEIIEEEEDEDLRDRARIYLLRIDPDKYSEQEDEEYDRSPQSLHIEFKHLTKKGVSFSIGIPWALADLALGAMSAEDMSELRKELRSEGLNLDKLLKDVRNHRGEIFELKTKDAIIKIWVK
ncbi:tol-pal system YbgF family protein [Acidobacteriota bacterium]